MAPRRKDMIGQRFGRLVVVKQGESKFIGHAQVIRWECRCDCGGGALVPGCHLRNLHTQSCGCRKREQFEEVRHRRWL